jgi:ABC-type polysaccharide/polyol phosphate export permease
VTDITDPAAFTTGANGAAGGIAELVIPPEPVEPDPATWYKHRVHMRRSLKALWENRDMLYTLAQRDIRTSYKQAVLGFAWAFVNPLMSLIVYSIIFSHVKVFKTPGIPYPIFMFAGMMIWGFFTGSVSSGSTAVLGNLAMMQKTSFPRECFPLSQMLEQVVYTSIGWLPMIGMFFIYHFMPHWQVVFTPIVVVPELLLAAGVMLAFGSAIIYIRDLSNLMGLVLQLGMFASPVIWPFDKIPVWWHGIPTRAIYSAFNPIGPVIDSFRNILLVGKYPDWPYLGIAFVASILWFVGGYRMFKRLEVSFADIA